MGSVIHKVKLPVAHPCGLFQIQLGGIGMEHKGVTTNGIRAKLKIKMKWPKQMSTVGDKRAKGNATPEILNLIA